ncbi:MAG: DUF5320 domain-containing protein [Chloroflexota bacterium]
MPWGYGSGFCRGWGAGWQNDPAWGCRRHPGRPRRWRSMIHPYGPRGTERTESAEAEALRQQASFLKQQLEAIDKRLKEMENKE